MPSGDGQPRTYSIAIDTANGILNPTMLIAEIGAAAGILCPVRVGADGGWLETVGDVMNLWFSAPLTGLEITALDAVVAAHIDGITTRGPVFFSDDSEHTVYTSLETFLSGTTPMLTLGTYKVMWQAETRYDYEQEGRVTSYMYLNNEEIAQSRNDSREYVLFSGWTIVTVVEGQTLQLAIKATGYGDNGAMRIRRLKLWVEETHP